MPTASPISKQLQMEALLNGPAGAPPAGILPEFQQPASLKTVFFLVIALCITISSLTLLIRIYTRHFLLRSMGYDDYTSIVAWLCLIAYLITGRFAVRAGLGVHMWDLQLKDFFGLLYWVNVVTIIYSPTAFFAKLSILLQYSRVFNPTGKSDLPLFLTIRISILCVLIFYFVRMFFAIFQCDPRERIWDLSITSGHCYDGNAAYKARGIFNVMSDFAILIMPMPSVWSLNMSLRKKLLTTCVFASGLLACMTSILRTYYTWRIVATSDKSYWFGQDALCSSAELSVGVITGCLPVVPKFFQLVGPKVQKVLSSQMKTVRTTTLTKIKSSLAKYSTGLSTSDSYKESSTQPHGDYYTLDELEASRCE